MPLNKTTTPSPWYASRKLWITLIAGVLITAVALAGPSVGLDDEVIRFVIGALSALALGLIGAHAYTDVRSLNAAVYQNGDAMRTNAMAGMVENILPLLSTVFSAPPSVDVNGNATPVPSEPPAVEVVEEEEDAG